MNTTQIEIGLIGDFLIGSFRAHPSPLKGGEGHGLRPEHFTDPSARAAFELILNAGTDDPAELRALIIPKMGVEFCEKAIDLSSEVPAYALGRLSLMNCRGQGGYVRDAILARVKTLKPDFVIIDPRYKLMRPRRGLQLGRA